MRIVLIAAALLAGCAAEPAARPPEASPDAAAGSPQPKSRSATLPMLSADGWGPLRIGMTLAEVTRALGPDSDPEAAGGPEPERCDQFRPARAPAGMLVMIEEGRLTSIALIEGSPVRTDRGVGLGDPSSVVQRAHGAAVMVSPNPYMDPPARTITAWARGGGGAGAQTLVENRLARGITYDVDEKERIFQIRAGGPSIQYVEGCA